MFDIYIERVYINIFRTWNSLVAEQLYTQHRKI